VWIWGFNPKFVYSRVSDDKAMRKVTIFALIAAVVGVIAFKPANEAPVKRLTHPQRVVLVETKQAEPIDRTDLVQALIMVESSGREDAYNEQEDAVGCLQIRRVMVKDVNRILKKQGEKKRFKMKDRWNCEKAVEIFEVYTDYYHPNEDDETVARGWNGGPDGYTKLATEKYWDKVQRHIKVK